MENNSISEELRFLVILKNLSKQSLLDAYLRSGNFPLGFDIGKAMITLNRLFDAEIEYASENPDEYTDIYKN